MTENNRRTSYSERKFKIIYAVFGLLFMVGVTAAYITLSGTRLDFSEVFGTVMSELIFLTGLYIILLTPIKNRLMRFYCSEKIIATVKSVETIYTYDSGGEEDIPKKEYKSYLPTYRYEFNGKTYTSQAVFSTPSKPSKGDKAEIWVNPKSPDEFFEKGGSSSLSWLTVGVGAAACVLSGAVILSNMLYG